MSRKRSFREARLALPESRSESGTSEHEVAYEYYSPGCYCIPPNHIGQTMPHSSTYLRQCPVQWNCCNTATYVVDSYGMVYYLSDFEHQLHLSSGLAHQTGASYLYHYDTDTEGDMDDEAGVSACKRGRFEEAGSEADCDPVDQGTGVKGPSKKRDTNVYRSEEGYLVEEPVDEE